jgi:hypothetical protein
VTNCNSDTNHVGFKDVSRVIFAHMALASSYINVTFSFHRPSVILQQCVPVQSVTDIVITHLFYKYSKRIGDCVLTFSVLNEGIS